MDVAHGEMVEAELNRLMEKRAALENPEANEELWQQSVRRYNARRQEEMRAAWCEHHQRQAACLRATLEALIARHEKEAAKLMDTREEGKSA